MHLLQKALKGFKEDKDLKKFQKPRNVGEIIFKVFTLKNSHSIRFATLRASTAMVRVESLEIAAGGRSIR